MQKQIFKIFLILTIFLMLPSFVLAAPSITSIGGNFSDGQAVTVSGSLFGSNSAVGTSDLEFLGEEGGPIESGSAGTVFSRTGWTTGWDWPAGVLKYSTDQFHSGGKSLKGLQGGLTYNSILSYKLQSPVTVGQELLISYWVRKVSQGAGQWKMLRLSMPETIKDYDNEVLFTSWNNGNGHYMAVNPGAGSPPRLIMSWGYDAVVPENNDTWYRMDIHVKAGTTGMANGEIIASRYWPGNAYATHTGSNLPTHYDAGDDWEYIIWQNYFGNGYTSGTVWLDDIYIQKGTQSRVELCDTSSWSARTKCEIQKPSSWNDGQLQIKVNQGSFPDNSTAYLYVVDANGDASAGKQITFGSSQASTCIDLIQNGNETGIDCGGSCPACIQTYSISNLLTLVSNWLKAGTVSDVNGDNVVNTRDLGIMMSKWN